MSSTEDYAAKAAASLAAAEAATNERDRAFYHRAYSIWRQLIRAAVAKEQGAVSPAKVVKSVPTFKDKTARAPKLDRFSTFKT